MVDLAGHDGLRIAALLRPGPPSAVGVIAVHATGFCKETWLPVLDRLANNPVLAIDQRGHGDSEAPDPPFDWWDLGRDVLAALDTVEWQGPVGVGHSSGAAALAMAELVRPGTFRSLVLVEPIVFPPPYVRIEANPMAETAERRRREFRSPAEARASYAGRGPFAGWSEEALDAYVEHGFALRGGRWVLKCAPEVEAEFYRSATTHGAWDRLEEIHCPVVLVAGAGSTSHPMAFLDRQADRFVRAVVHRVPDATHFVPMERPEVVSAIVARAIEAAE